MKHVLILILFFGSPLAARGGTQVDADWFEKHIRPVLVKHCYECHSTGADTPQGGLLLDTRNAMREGGDSGPAVIPGDVDGSLLLEALRYESYEMPPSGRLPDEVIAKFETWIAKGAVDPRDGPTGTTSSAKPAAIDWEAAADFWAFQPPQRHEPPATPADAISSNPIDAFVQTRLAEEGLSPNPPADRRVIIRRLTYDLTGLPPTPEEVDAFVSVDSPQAYDQLVERLLASPHFGERWAAMWLDVARYAEDQAHIVGNNKSLFYPNAWMYRDWLIQAFNNDLPYDEFVRLQLAADLIHPEDTSSHVALGYLGLGPKYYRRGAPEVMADEWEDRVDVVGRGLLGLTVACARCHDHKYDPIPTSDYYALAGVFASTEMFNRPLTDEAEANKDGQAKEPDQAIHIVREGKPEDIAVMIRGDVNRRGDVVPRHFLSVLEDGSPRPFGEGSGRRQLAESIASADNPLTARVIVNRIWAQYFGRGLVGTPSNFGLLGEAPTHPQLLDDLAARFMEQGWSLKWLHREIVTSATYRQSSAQREEAMAADPANRLLWRMPRRRMSVEQWRDSILTASGRLADSVGGPSIVPSDPQEQRRTVYSGRSRFQLNAMLAMFDFPDPNAHSGRRVETTTPLQKLFVINSPFMVQQATWLVERANADVGEEPAARIDRLYRLLYGRAPTDDELTLAVDFTSAASTDGPDRWQQLAQVLLASNELLFID
ncbi:Planctomycete cytochrome C [Maioricimonas rarisocia]|uniref:Planctomycete cytochrome C n=1 Tax=Maioricimonas rarisocia TaxID=2528026 RepID=A0A517Z476_9PLAN|nr:PSD1 and planctomycete cytochrome C domain-containing protein [Maioricimonas rarisocia]QDU37290.1 Planctomycete cytochrome C [Maioricimonas rarisocia]